MPETLRLGFVSVGRGEAVTLNPGDILVADDVAHAVIRVNPADGTQTVVASGGNFSQPTGIAIVPPPRLPPGSCGGSVACACGDRVVLDRPSAPASIR